MEGRESEREFFATAPSPPDAPPRGNMDYLPDAIHHERANEAKLYTELAATRKRLEQAEGLLREVSASMIVAPTPQIMPRIISFLEAKP